MFYDNEFTNVLKNINDKDLMWKSTITTSANLILIYETVTLLTICYHSLDNMKDEMGKRFDKCITKIWNIIESEKFKNIDSELITEIRFLLCNSIWNSQCPEWQAYKGDCNKVSCTFCRIQHCDEKLGEVLKQYE